MAKREIEWDGRWYKVKSDKIELPVLSELPRFEALLWLNRETYPRGYSRSAIHWQALPARSASGADDDRIRFA